MINKRFPKYPDDTDYNTNSPSYYDDLARKQKLIQLLAEKIWEYENTLNETLEQIEQRLTDYILENDLLMNERLENWDKRIDEMPEEMRSLFVTWLNDGTLEQIINHDVLGNKADKTFVDSEIQRLEQKDENIAEHLAQTEMLNEPRLSGEENDTNRIIRGINNAVANQSNTLILPAGEYVVDPDVIELPANFTLAGISEQSTIIVGSRPNGVITGTGIAIKGQRSTVRNLTIREFETGISVEAYWTKVYDNILSYNRVGIHAKDRTFICKFLKNEITFNGMGILITGESYQLNIKDNIIDNNNLGIGMTGERSTGLVVADNTIEGNRNLTTNVGCGMLISGQNISRLDIRGNWFESNGQADESTDILVLGRNFEGTFEKSLRNVIVTNCVNENLQSLFNRSTDIGAVNIESNAFVFTKRNIFASIFKTSYMITSNSFKGTKDKYNEHIYISFAGSSGKTARLVADGNSYYNSDNALIDSEVTKGLKGTIIHTDADEYHDDQENYIYNGKPLFEYETTIDQLISDFETVFVTPTIISGGGEVEMKALLNKKYNGYQVTGNVGNDIQLGDVDLFEGKGDHYVIAIGEPNSVFRWDSSDGRVGRRNTLANEKKFKIEKLTSTVNSGAITDNASIIYGFVFITPEEYEEFFNGVRYVKIKDFETQYIA